MAVDAVRAVRAARDGGGGAEGGGGLGPRHLLPAPSRAFAPCAGRAATAAGGFR